MPRIVRSQNPPPLGNYKKYKPYLRIDFDRRCAYCHMPETRYGGPRNFAVEHFRPKKLFPSLKCDYSNLYYACNSCNDFKGARWPTHGEQAHSSEFVDPCESALSAHIGFDGLTGAASPFTIAGRYTSNHLNLDRDFLRIWRAGKQDLERRLTELDAIIVEIETDADLHLLPLGQRLVENLGRERQRVCRVLATEYADWW